MSLGFSEEEKRKLLGGMSPSAVDGEEEKRRRKQLQNRKKKQQLELQKQKQKQKQKQAVTRKGKQSADTVESSDDEDDENDGDEEDWSADEEDDEEGENGMDEGRDLSSDSDGDDGMGHDDIDEGVDDIAVNATRRQSQKPLEKRKRINNMIARSNCVRNYDFDDENGGWATVTLALPTKWPIIPFVTLIEERANHVKIRETKNISRCSVVKSNQDLDVEDTFMLEGLNLHTVRDYAHLFDVNRLNCNDIQSVFATYGVEAGRASIIQELVAVFGVYGISVDFRHLSVIADYMTFEGTFRGMNRITMRSNVSPFTQMSFESTVDFLKRAVVEGDHDPLKSNSSRLVVGNLTVNGTGCFDVLNPLV
eukprot:m.186966 g.186966  ORF g.186966 m.186966 type:complete len:365 (+) comp13622_c2_seq4:122-1216(+)